MVAIAAGLLLAAAAHAHPQDCTCSASHAGRTVYLPGHIPCVCQPPATATACAWDGQPVTEARVTEAAAILVQLGDLRNALRNLENGNTARLSVDRNNSSYFVGTVTQTKAIALVKEDIAERECRLRQIGVTSP